jgi:DNA polymerase (family 10)
MNNKEISAIVSLYAKLAELHGEDSFRTKSYSNAAFQINKSQEPLTSYDEQEWLSMPGFGKGIVPKLMSLTSTGTFPQLDNYLENTPKGVLAMLRIKGLGAKKLLIVWKEMGIETVGELLYACKENRLKDVKGFGIKTQASILQQIEFMYANADKFHYATAEAEAMKILAELKALPGCTHASTCGPLRRKEIILDKIDFLYAGDKSPLEKWAQNRPQDENVKFPIGIHHCEDKDFVAELIQRTGNKEFLESIGFEFKEYKTEEDFFKEKKRNYLPPECRHGREYEKDVDASKLIEYRDLKGVLHNHSTYSDGLHSLEEMASFVKENGFEYFAISDHSKAAFYANGLSEDRIIEQHREIDLLNAKMKGFKTYKSIEADILNNGDLDYDKETLNSFDFVIASVHSNLKMDKEKAHARLIKAIENPHTRILGHLTTRLLLAREGYPVDHNYIIDACAENGVCIELNANPYRLDIDWQWIPYCMRKDVLISINPDAHNKDGIFDMKYGTYAARKGLLTKDMCLNALSLEDFEKWVNNK